MKTKNYSLLLLIAIFITKLSFGQANFKLDPSFANNGFFKQTKINANASVCPYSAIQTDGKIIFAGLLINVDDSNVDSFVVYRFNTNGTVDNAFGNNGMASITVPHGQIFANSVNGLLIQPDGKIVILGNYPITGGMQGTILARFNTNGTLDNTFGVNGKVNHTIFPAEVFTNLNIQSNGKIVIGGFAYYDSIPHSTISRFNPNGTADATFDVDNGGDKIVDPIGSTFIYRMLIDNTDKMMALHGMYDPGMNGGKIRLNKLTADGLNDATFGTNGFVEVGSFIDGQHAGQPTLNVLANGKYVVTITDNDTTTVFQFLNNGTKDLSFNGIGFKKIVNPILKEYFAPVNILPLDNNNFALSQTQIDSNINGTDYTTHRLIGIKADGGLMPSFGKNGILLTQLPPDGSVGYGCKQPDGKLVFGVPEPSTRFTALRYATAFGTFVNEAKLSTLNVNLYPNPNQGNFTLSIVSNEKEAPVKITIINMMGQIVNELNVGNNNGVINSEINANLSTGIYFVKVQLGLEVNVAKILVK